MNFDGDVTDDAGGVAAIIADSRPREPLFPKILRATRFEYIFRSDFDIRNAQVGVTICVIFYAVVVVSKALNHIVRQPIVGDRFPHVDQLITKLKTFRQELVRVLTRRHFQVVELTDQSASPLIRRILVFCNESFPSDFAVGFSKTLRLVT